MHARPNQGPDIKNLALAIVAATIIMSLWQYFYERPRQAAERAHIASQQVKQATQAKVSAASAQAEEADALHNPRIAIHTDALNGSINLIGGRFDVLTLAHYHETLDKSSPEVPLLAPAGNREAYFVELGLLGDGELKLPDATTPWKSTDKELTNAAPVTMTWSNGAGLKFTRTIAVDEHYMFTITTKVKNEGVAPVTVYPYGLISRNEPLHTNSDIGVHEGPIGAFDNVLEDTTYSKLKKDGSKEFKDVTGWFGITDKFWLTTLIPAPGDKFTATFKHFMRGDTSAYQVDMRGNAVEIPVGDEKELSVRMFAGAKEVNLLDGYRDSLNIPLFDRVVNYGSLYFIARPIFDVLTYFYDKVGNFGVAILLLTILIKALLYPLTHKSMVAMSKMRILTPKMAELKERFGDDKMRFNQEVMALYKREKVNPATGCLPILLQMPVFFALYRVLSVSLEMRHAPFFGWIKDLSMPDPSNLFTLFGLVPWDAPASLQLGLWPIILCATMIFQQRLSPKPADPIQAAMMTYMPFIFLIMFMRFPAGLVIYYSWNNLLSVVQQYIINKQLEKKGLRHK